MYYTVRPQGAVFSGRYSKLLREGAGPTDLERAGFAGFNTQVSGVGGRLGGRLQGGDGNVCARTAARRMRVKSVSTLSATTTTFLYILARRGTAPPPLRLPLGGWPGVVGVGGWAYHLILSHHDTRPVCALATAP